jgi:hypothetical protein
MGMKKLDINDKEVRFYVDLDVVTRKVLGWDYDHRMNLVKQEPADPNVVRIYLTKGQYNKLLKKGQTL